MAKISNVNYEKFLKEGVITTLSELDIIKAMNNIKGRYDKEARALVATLYYTGGRPVEVLDVKAKDVTRESHYIIIRLRGAKGGLPRPIYLSIRNAYVKEIYDLAKSLFGEIYLFYHYRGKYSRHTVNKKGEPQNYIEISYKLRYHFKRWFDNVIEGGINPYYLRHNRFSKLAEKGATMEQIRLIKGAKSFNSITPYIHLSTRGAKQISKIND